LSIANKKSGRTVFNIQATIKWVTAIAADPNSAAAAYRETAAAWQQSFIQLTLPLYVAAYLVAVIVAFVTGGSFLFGALSPGVLMFSLIWGLAWTFVIAFIFDFLAGMFAGRRSFDAAYSVVALAIIPSAAGIAVSPLPWIGWLLSLAASLYSLMLAYRFLPIYMEIPEAARVKHFVLSVVAALVLNLLVSFTAGSIFAPSVTIGSLDENPSQPVGTAMFSGLERQAELTEAAARDSYDPPANGELTEKQVRNYIDVTAKTQALQERLSESLQGMEDKEPSLTDVMSGVGGALRLSTAEMEVVKSGGGNWAEHQWVKNQLETARIQQDLNPTTEHNYRLFLKYQEEIEQLE
jgi:hypothetical protein